MVSTAAVKIIENGMSRRAVSEGFLEEALVEKDGRLS
jgi:hypothetical protein